MTARSNRYLPSDPEPGAPEIPSGSGLSRRAALQGLAGSLGAALTVPTSAAEAHPVGLHVAQRPQTSPAAKAAKSVGPIFLDRHQFATLTLVAEIVVPGATASESPRFIDEMLAVERHDVQRRFVSALGAIDAAAREQHGRSFRDLPKARQVALLEAAAAEPSGRPDSSPQAPEDSVERDVAVPRVTGVRDPFDHLKTWIAGAHFSSEPGMKELGWTGGMFFPSFPGCTHPDGHE